MTTKQMDCALELSKVLNFSRAAENLFISQPSLTYQIQCLENEIGFRLFERSGKGAELTPAGAQFCGELQRIRDELKAAVEQGQNMSSRYSEALNVCIPMRSCIYFLPQIMQRFEAAMPHVSLNIRFVYEDSRVDMFLRREQDILFARESELKRFSNVRMAPLFHSRFYVILRKDDPLAGRELLTVSDLSGRTFMVGGGSPGELIAVQNRIVESGQVSVLNCPNHETALANVAAQKGIVLAPGFTDDHNGEFAWVPFDCAESISCVLGYHREDNRASTRLFIELAQAAYAECRAGKALEKPVNLHRAQQAAFIEDMI
ncbi:LysR family transcriptional regulator [Oscillibacter sp. 1-3]|uniref:LysR family transcriptional regulator n=1 Tax=Oscillibacter sp. 1-3 TaxID=1235797 RepID=UPI00033EB720|nr:LysR family transcriptional regulator [Oscillibacter sp. 1-3]EOS67062.1 hypothetical protein C816_01211 [Oscillibacter sp. 1-3]MCI9511509.1 LysR family transcriptional regulator [Oscillibacter sp.]